MKPCSTCGTNKELVDFCKNKNSPDGRAGRCKDCHNAASRAYAKAFPEKSKESYTKSRNKRKPAYADRHLRNKYGITLAKKQEMCDAQKNTCAICPTQFLNLSKAHVDHNHATKAVRGLLCHQCNVSIGLLKEDKLRIENIRLYLARHDGNFANMSKFSAYLKEREGVDTVETREGYATYLIKGDECLIKDIFVLPEYRRQHFASSIADRIAEIARAMGCKFLTGTVCPLANGCTDSLKVLIGYGMRLHSTQQNLIIFIKEL